MTPAQNQGDNREMAEDIYDKLMLEIEPDLLLASIPTLDQKYAGETAEQHEARMQRYENAYKEFDKRLAVFMNEVEEKARTAKKDARVEKERKAREQEAQQLNSLEQAFE